MDFDHSFQPHTDLMNTAQPRTRREFLGQVGQGMMIASIGYEVATGLGLSSAMGADAAPALNFGKLEPLVGLMQDTPAAQLLPKLAAHLQSGTTLRDLVSAGALANARTFGGENYVGYHTAMALMPSWHMAQEMTGPEQALPIFKVLYRNTSTIQGSGGRAHEVLHEIAPATLAAGKDGSDVLRDATRRKDMAGAEQTFAAIAAGKAEDAYNAMLHCVLDHDEVHRVGLAYRSWDLLSLVGKEHAHTLLRQSVRYCVHGGYGGNGLSELLPKVFEQHKLDDRTPGTRKGDDAWVDKLSRTIFEASANDAAHAVAAAIAEGFSLADIGEALTLASNQLILRDHGRTPEMEAANKPIGSLHGDSIGVHGCDSANAWRNMSRSANTRNSFACLIVGAHQVAKDRVERGGDFLHWQPMPPAARVKDLKTTDGTSLLRDAEAAIRSNLQIRAATCIQRYGDLNLDPQAAFALMRKYAISEDGSLHAEKFYRTASDDFNSTRAAFRWRHLVALARVTASEYGRPAEGIAQARELLKV